MKQRLDYIDKAKGILIILMVIGHVWQSGYVHNVIYTFHMPAFFVISGMLLNYTQGYRKCFKEYVKRKLYSYVVPFVFIEILGCITDIVRHGITLNIKGYLYNTLILDFNDPNLWFLYTLFWIEIIFFLLKKVCKNDKIIWIISIIVLVGQSILPRGNSYINGIINVCIYWIFFIIGFYSSELFKRKNRGIIVVSIVFIFVVAAIFGKRSGGALTVENLAFIISGLCGTYIMLQIGTISLGNKLDKLLSKAGINTIIIYGTHRLYYATVGAILGITDYANTPLWAGSIMLVVVAVLEIPTIYIINRWLPFLAGKRMRRSYFRNTRKLNEN